MGRVVVKFLGVCSLAVAFAGAGLVASQAAALFVAVHVLGQVVSQTLG